MTTRALAAALVLLAAPAAAEKDYNASGSVQLDYLAMPTERFARATTFDATTMELSLKVDIDFTPVASASVKVCFACHGFEAGMAYVDLRAADELVVRIGRMTPAFGAFPARHDPANHRTSDKPLPYDMGRMPRLRDWNEGILPAPWVDNGVEVLGTHFLEGGRIEYAAYAIAGPKGPADAADFDFTLSRSPAQYYLDNNSQPAVGARFGGMIELTDAASITLGASGMAGTYDPERRLTFLIVGADVAAQLGGVMVRGEYLFRRTEIALGADPASRFKYGPGADGRFDDFFVKDGFYAEVEVPVGRVDLIARWDGLRRRGNVLADSELSSRSHFLRYTAGAAVRVAGEVRIKGSVELYDFSDFDTEVGVHLGAATAF